MALLLIVGLARLALQSALPTLHHPWNLSLHQNFLNKSSSFHIYVAKSLIVQLLQIKLVEGNGTLHYIPQSVSVAAWEMDGRWIFLCCVLATPRRGITPTLRNL